MRARIALAAAGAGCALLLPNAASAGPAVSVAPSQLSFGAQCIGAPSNELEATVTNSGDAALQISSIVMAGAHAADFTLSGAQARTLAPGEAMKFRITFTPLSTGDRNGLVRITSNAPSSPHEIPAIGSGATRTLEVTPDRLVFGDRRTGSSSDALVLSLASVGSAPVTISGVTIGGEHRGDFSVRGPAQRTLRPGEDGVVSVSFRPRAVGDRRGSVTIESDACAGRTTIAVSGRGTAPNLRVSPSPIDFGGAALGSIGPAVPVVVSNQGRAPLRITDIRIEGAQAQEFRFAGFPDLPKVLGAGEEFSVDATFAPVGEGPRRALLRIVSDDPDSPNLSVEMTGNLPGAATLSGSPSPSPLDSASPSPSAGSVAGPRRRSGGTGGSAGDYLAVAVVASGVGGVFAALFMLRRRRSFAE